MCGQAMSHCVNLTYRDLAAYYSGKNRQLLEKLVLLEDCTSYVTGFEDEATRLLHDITDPKNGIGGNTSTAEEAFAALRK